VAVRHSSELSGANCHAKLSHLKQLLKKYSYSDVCTILLTAEKIFTVVKLVQTEKPKKISITKSTQLQQPRRKTSRQNACSNGQRPDSH